MLLKTAEEIGFADCKSATSLMVPHLKGSSWSCIFPWEMSDFDIVDKSRQVSVTRVQFVLQLDELLLTVIILLY